MRLVIRQKTPTALQRRNQICGHLRNLRLSLNLKRGLRRFVLFGFERGYQAPGMHCKHCRQITIRYRP
jgi:hypothetical protein